MALGKKYKSVTGAGTLAALILVLVFGSPWYLDWATKHADGNSGGDWWLRLLAWPHWEFNSKDSLRNVVVGDLKAILVVVLTLVFLYLLPGSQLARARGTISQFFAGWASYVFAGAFAALFTTLFLANPSLVNAFQSATSGAAYGAFAGWIVGIATLGGYRR